MPKITIIEKDNTKPGVGSYSNFAVLVPGFTAKNYKTEAFDINGVAYFTSAADFQDAVGLVNPLLSKDETDISNIDIDGVKAAVSVQTSARTQLTKKSSAYKYDIWDNSAYVEKTTTWFTLENVNGKVSSTSTELSPLAKILRGLMYERTTLTEDSPEYGKYGKFYEVVKSGETITACYKYEPVSATDDLAAKAGTDYYYIIDSGYPVPMQDVPQPTFTEPDVSNQYPVGKFGNAAVSVDKIDHYGNQMAYSLLNLGYAVYYKKITNVGQLNNESMGEGNSDFWGPMKDKSAYDFRYVVTGLLTANSGANEKIIDLAESAITFEAEERGRGDIIALCDLDETEYRNSLTQTALIDAVRNSADQISNCSKYSALFTPAVTYAVNSDEKTHFGSNSTYPASYHYLACAKLAESNNYPEWFAVAGYNRGVAARDPKSTTALFGDAALRDLCPRNNQGVFNKAVNLIIKIKNRYYIWGNRTAHTLGEELVASDFLNIRQLCVTIKKQVWTACRRFTFDPNSDVLWINFKNAIRPTLDQMKANQGIDDYEIIRVESTQKGKFCAQIRIVPIEAVEDFEIELSLEDNLGDVSVSVSETA